MSADRVIKLLSSSHRLWPRTPAAWAAAVLGLFVLALAWLLFVGIELSGEPWRPALARIASRQLDRELRLDGELKLRISLKPALLVRDARLLQPRGFETVNEDFVRVGELQVKLDLWPLLRGRLRADTLSASDVTLALVQHEDGSSNWAFGAPQAKPEVPNASGDDAGFSASDAAAIDIRRLVLKNIRVSYRGDDGKPMQASLDTLEASAPAGGKLALHAEGRLEQRLPYALQIDGGSWTDFATGRAGWPLALTLDFAGGRLSVQGTLREADSQLRFGLGAPDLAGFGKLLGVPLPNAGTAGVSGAVRLRPGRIELSDLSGILGKSAMRGSMGIDSRGERPQLHGDLRFATLDLRPFLGQDSEQDPPTDWQALYKSLSNATLDLQALKDADAELNLSVDQWLSLPGRIDHAMLKLTLAGGRLGMPVAAVVEGVPLKGQIDADASTDTPALRIAFHAQNAEVGGLAHMLTGLPGIEGRLGRLQLNIAARGSQGRELMRSLAIDTELVNSRLSYGGSTGSSTGSGTAKRVGFTVEQLKMNVAGKQPLSGQFRGTLLGKPLQANLAGESLISAMDKGSSPVTLTLQSGNIVGRFAGVIDGSAQSADFTFSLGAGKAGDVAAWLGLRPDSTLPIALAGKLRGTPQKWSLSQLLLQVGDSSAYSDIDQVQKADKSHLSVLVDIASVNLKQLDGLFDGPADAKSTDTKNKRATTLDIPILPTGLVLDDADLRVRARDVRGTQLVLGEMGFDGRVRDGYMQSSPFFAHVSGSRYEGAVMLDLRSAEPHAQLWLSAAGVDVGLLARQLKLAKHIDASLDRVALYLDTRSSQLSSLMANARLQGEAVGGKLALRDPNTGSELRAALERLSLSAAPGERIAVQVTGSIDDQPLQATLRSATAKELADPTRRVPFDLQLDVSGATRLRLSGSMDRDIDARDVELALELTGEKFNRLDKLLRVSLPPWGPWSVAGRFKMNTRGYAVDDMLLKVGSSSLKGRGRMDTGSGRAKLDIALGAPLIQLDDFKLDGWSALGDDAGKDKKPAKNKGREENKEDGKEEANHAQALRKKAIDASDQVQALLSPATLQQADATLSVQVDQVLSGKDRLGQGRLQAKLANGRAEIGPVQVEMPGGQAKLALSYEPREKEVLADLKLDVDNFNYGVLGRRLKPDSDLDGRFSLKMDVNARAPRLSQMLAHGNGRIDFAVWPKDLRAGVFDLWAVNLLVALLPTVDPKNESTVNCAVGRFALNDGKLAQKQMVIDTSRMRVTGTTAVDFGSERVHMRLQPQAKAAQFLSLATPIEVRGSFTDYDIGPNPGDVIETAVRLATSIVWVPIKRLFSEKVPADGRDVCVTSLQ